jgi:putative membrane protein
MAHERWVKGLGIVFLLIWAALAVAPWHRQDWVLENLLVVAAIPVVRAAWRRRLFSDASWTLLFLFMVLHQIGAHYTYSEVPYDAWWRWLTGDSFNAILGWQRNHFDRLVHFLYGALLALPYRETIRGLFHIRGFWSYLLPLNLVLSTSALYELLEWLAATVLGGDAGMTYLGIQGDIWDAQKDMALATLGALLALAVVAIIGRRDAQQLRPRLPSS